MTVKTGIEIINARSKYEKSASELFERIKIIPLETTDLSLAGRSIDRIEVWNDKIFIANHLGSHVNILCFDLFGKFLFHIDRMGQGPGEYTFLDDFFIDKNLNHVVFISEPNNRTLHFDMRGNFLYDIRPDNDTVNENYYPRHTIYLNDSTYLSLYERESEIHHPDAGILHFDSKTMNIRHISNNINELYYVSQPLSIFNDKILCITFNDSIFDISNINNVTVKYLLYNGDEQIKIKKEFRKKQNKMTWDEQINFMHNHYLEGNEVVVETIHENDKYIALSCWKQVPQTDNHILYFLLYDKINKKTYNSDNITFDGFILQNCPIAGVDNESLYCVLNTEITDEDKDKIRKSKIFSDENKKLFLEHKDEDNPLLIVLK
jgi:hypothetical protein